jgi:hypothetical protein
MLFEGFYPTQVVGLTGCASSVLFILSIVFPGTLAL